jgi:hypothetical protein
MAARKCLKSDVFSEARRGGGDEPDWCRSHC